MSIRIVRMNVKQNFNIRRNRVSRRDQNRIQKHSGLGQTGTGPLAFVLILCWSLIGCSVGAPTPVRQPTATSTMIVDRIIRTATLPPALRPSPSPTPSDGMTHIQIGDDYFEPAAATIKHGTTVEWWHGGGHDHVIASSKNDWPAFWSNPGNRNRITLSNPGDYPYVCLLHSGMIGMIRVLD
jgi:plastocyanin